MKRFLVRTFAMAGKEVAHILRDRQMLALAMLMPVLLLFVFGYAVSFDIENVPLVVVDRDETAASRQLVDRFATSGTFRIVARRGDESAVEPLFRNGAAKVGLVIPKGYGNDHARGREAEAQLLLDGSDNSTASVALGYANAVALAASQARLAELAGGMRAPLEVRARTFFNPALRSAIFLVPGLIVLVLVMIAVMLTALTVAREYERGSMEQLFATPVGRLEVILGKLGPYLVLGLVQVLLVLTLGVTLFDVPVRGSLLLVFGVATLFLMAMLMQGLLISVVTRNQMVASQVAAVSTFLPAMLLSGFLFPIENMPLPLQVISAVLPPRYLVHSLRSILLRGNGLEVVAADMVPVALFFLVMMLVATARFRRQVA